MATSAELKSQIIEIYIATFNRAPDALGLTYWVNDGTSATTSLSDPVDVAKAMLASPEAATVYEGMNREAKIIEIYANVLNKTVASTDSGVEYWSAGGGSSVDEASLIIAIINGAKADTGNADDKQLLENKKALGEYFAVTLALDDLDTAKTSMQRITKDTATLSETKHRLDAFKGSFDFIEGTTANDKITGSTATDYIYTYAGDDNILSGDGDNVIVSGDGIDNISAGAGADTIYADAGDDTVYAKAGNDTIYGGAGNDSLHADAGDDTIYANGGNDYLYGDAGNDILHANEGNDFVYGGKGDDFLYGEEGDDYIYTTDGTNFIDAGSGDDTIYGGTGVDTIYGGAGKDTIYANDGADIIDGLTDDDIIYAAKGDDQVYGNEGSDILNGGDGADSISGEKGDDTIIGGQGSDILSGGEGKDTFVVAQQDSTVTNLDFITDFVINTDKIQLQNQGTEVINSSQTIVTPATSLQAAADLTSTQDGSVNSLVNWFIYEDNTYLTQDLSADITFNNSSDIIIKLQGIIDLSSLDSTTISFA